MTPPGLGPYVLSVILTPVRTCRDGAGRGVQKKGGFVTVTFVAPLVWARVVNKNPDRQTENVMEWA
jgi:hypothetical protein